jgi:(1->4)-alpha-D-glucan 1-alpha-D-glucosylmutase
MADGRIKLYVTALALRCRRAHPGLFSAGSYSPLEAVGPQAEHVFSFARSHGECAALVAVPRLVAKLMPDAASLPHGPAVWGETMLPLPEELAGRSWHSLFTGETLTPREYQGRPALPAASIFGSFPVALLLDRIEGEA